MRYLIYLRVSTKDQDNRNQQDACMSYLRAKHSNEPFEYLFFCDKVTSKKGVYEREGSKQLLKTMQPGDTLVCIRIDRLSRIPEDSHKLLAELERKKINIIAIDQPGLSNFVMAGLYAGMAAEEVKTLRKRIIEKFDSKRSRGEMVGQLPYGYSLDPNKLVPIKVGEKFVDKPAILIPNPKEQEVLSLMAQFRAEGLSFRNISKKLLEHGIRNRAGSPFPAGHICLLLARRDKPKGHSQSHPEQEHQNALVAR